MRGAMTLFAAAAPAPAPGMVCAGRGPGGGGDACWDLSLGRAPRPAVGGAAFTGSLREPGRHGSVGLLRAARSCRQTDYTEQPRARGLVTRP